MSERVLRYGAPAALFLITCAAAIAAILTSRDHLLIAAFWPVNGIALVALMRLRRQLESRTLAWAAIAAALFLANMIGGSGVANSAWFTAGNVLEIAVAYLILRAGRDVLSPLGERGPVTRLLPGMLLAGVAAPACGALIGAFGLSQNSDAAFGMLWLQWWLPDTLGMLVVVPFGLFVSKEDLLKLREPRALRHVLFGLALLAAALAAIPLMQRLAFILVVGLLVMLAAARFRALGAAVTIAISAWFIIPLTADPDAMRFAAVADATDRLVVVQSFLVLIGLMAISVSAVLDERDALVRALEARRLAATDAAQGRLRLLMNVAHEIRTPLNVIQGCSEMTMTAGPFNERQGELMTAVIGATRQLQALASDLLESARLEHNAVALHPQTVSPLALIEAAVADVRGSLDWRGPVQISVTCARMWADPMRFRQVATNLISNAAKFGGAYGPIRISLSEGVDFVLLGVSDCGPGFSPGREHEAFEPFAASSARVTSASAGVGLSLVKQLVEAHGGMVRCVSTPFIDTRIEAEFPAEQSPRAIGRLAAQAEESVDPASVFGP